MCDNTGNWRESRLGKTKECGRIKRQKYGVIVEILEDLLVKKTVGVMIILTK